MINFIKTKSTLECEEKLYKTLKDNLENNKKVLLIIAGGSNIPILKAVFDLLEFELTSNIDIILSDERFGPSDYQESNFVKLIKYGFDKKKANFINILTNQDIKTSTRLLEKEFVQKSQKANIIIAQLGIGEDGHIAGILPNSKALDSNDYVVNFKCPDFERITLSFKALKKIDIAIVAAYGAKKKKALKNLKNLKLPLNEMPSRILQEIKSIYIYNDQLE